MNKPIILKSGKEVYANRGMVSIIFNDKDEPEIGEGYDGEIFFTEWDEETDDYLPAYTQEELVELAEIIIERWKKFIRKVDSGEVPTK